MPKFKSYLNIFRILGIALFVYIAFQIDWNRFFATLKDASPKYFLAAVILILPLLFLLTLKWKAVIDSSGIKISFWKISRFFAKGLFLGLITPSKAGEFYRAKYLSESSGKSLGLSFFTVFWIKLADLIAMVLIGGVGALSLFFWFGDSRFRLLGILFLLSVSIAVYFLARKKMAKNIFKFFASFLVPAFCRDSVDCFLDDFYGGFDKLDYKTLGKIFVLEIATYAATVGACYLVALSLGISVPFWYLFLVNALIALIVTLPVSVFGLGTREAGYILFFSFLGISPESAVLFSLLVLVWGFFRAFPGLFFFLKDFFQTKKPLSQGP